MPGYEPVPRFRPGLIYLLVREGQDPDQEYFIAVFKKRTTGFQPAYRFEVLADNRNTTAPYLRNPSYGVWTIYKIEQWMVRRISLEDLPLFISSARVTPAFEQILKNGTLTRRKLAKSHKTPLQGKSSS